MFEINAVERKSEVAETGNVHVNYLKIVPWLTDSLISNNRYRP